MRRRRGGARSARIPPRAAGRDRLRLGTQRARVLAAAGAAQAPGSRARESSTGPGSRCRPGLFRRSTYPPPAWYVELQAPATGARHGASARRGTSLDVRDVLGRAPEIDDVLVRRRWKDRESRDNQGDPLLELEPAVYVGQLLGVRARPGGKVQCPFHTDVHPSLHVYPTATRGWSCFSCGRGGSIYDLAAALWGTGTRGREFVALRRRLTERLSSELSRATPPVRSVHRRAID